MTFHLRTLPSSSTLPVPEPPLAFGGTSFCAESGTDMTPPWSPVHHAAAGDGEGAGGENRCDGEYDERSWVLSPAVGGPASAERRVPDLAGDDRAFPLGRARVDTMKLASLSPSADRRVSAWIDDYAPSMGAALAYYTLFSIAPLLLIVISIAGLVFGPEAARGQIFAELRDLMGDEGAAAAQACCRASTSRRKGVLGTIVGVVLLGVGAISVFGELQNALDRIWRAPGRAGSGGVWALVRAASAVVRHGARHRLPAHRLAGRERRDRRPRQVLRRRCSAAGSLARRRAQFRRSASRS